MMFTDLVRWAGESKLPTADTLEALHLPGPGRGHPVLG